MQVSYEALLLSDTRIFEEVYSLSAYILAMLPCFRLFGPTNKLWRDVYAGISILITTTQTLVNSGFL